MAKIENRYEGQSDRSTPVHVPSLVLSIQSTVVHVLGLKGEPLQNSGTCHLFGPFSVPVHQGKNYDGVAAKQLNFGLSSSRKKGADSAKASGPSKAGFRKHDLGSSVVILIIATRDFQG